MGPALKAGRNNGLREEPAHALTASMGPGPKGREEHGSGLASELDADRFNGARP